MGYDKYSDYNKVSTYYYDNNHTDNILSIFPGYVDTRITIAHTDVFNIKVDKDHYERFYDVYHIVMLTEQNGYDDNVFKFYPKHGLYDNLHFEITGGGNEGTYGETNYSYTKGGNPHRDFKLQHIDIVNIFNANHTGLVEENVDKFTDNYFHGIPTYADGKYMEINWEEHYECNTHNEWTDHDDWADHSDS